jgi:hypothetical protein
MYADKGLLVRHFLNNFEGTGGNILLRAQDGVAGIQDGRLTCSVFDLKPSPSSHDSRQREQDKTSSPSSDKKTWLTPSRQAGEIYHNNRRQDKPNTTKTTKTLKTKTDTLVLVLASWSQLGLFKHFVLIVIFQFTVQV